jgi:hypothetical protein
VIDLAYIISAYKHPPQLVRLVERLRSPTSSFFIHVDRKTPPETYRAMVDGLAHLPEVCFLPRHRADWGGFGHVAATLEGINAIVRTETPCDYVVLLTGQDYPIKPPERIEAFLAGNLGQQFMEYFPLPHLDWEGCGLDRIEAWHLRPLGRRLVLDPRPWRRLQRRFPRGFRPFGGSSYWCLTRDAVEFVHGFARRNPAFINFFRRVDVPDELFFQTLLMNSRFAGSVVNDNLRHIEWHDPESGSPAILTTADLGRLRGSPQLFARKFDIMVDHSVLDEIDHTILGDPAGTKLPVT